MSATISMHRGVCLTNLKLFGEKVDGAVVLVEVESVLPKEAHFFFKRRPVLEFRNTSSGLLSNDAFDSLLNLLERHRMLDNLVIFFQLQSVWQSEKWFKSSEIIPMSQVRR
jgi:hypothetical protein